MRFWIGVMLACFLGVSAAQAVTQDRLKQSGGSSTPLVIGRMQEPKIDGHVNLVEWNKAGVINGFVDSLNGKSPNVPTKAYVGYDDKCIYVAVVCEEPTMNKVTEYKFNGKDGYVWRNESVELYLNPAADRISYYHFISDILGQRFDAIGEDPYGYNPDWKTAAYKGDKFWSVETSIPFTSLSTSTPKIGDHWYALLGRERLLGSEEPELTSSVATMGMFDFPDRYGMWVFSSLKLYLEKQTYSLSKESSNWPAEMMADSAGWTKRLKALQDRLTGMDEKAVQASYAQLNTDYNQLLKESVPLKIKALRIAAGGKSFIITKAAAYQPFSGGQILSGEQVGPMDITLMQDEWKDIALNVTNLSNDPITLHFTTRKENKNNDGFENYGLQGIDTLWQQAYAVAAGDGEKVYDAIVPTSAGVVQVPGNTTSQVWFSIHAPKDAAGTVEGYIVIEPIDNSGGKPIRLPIRVMTIPVQLTANSPLNSFTWDFLPFAPDKQPELAKAYYMDLKTHGINYAFISFQNHLPKVTPDADGTISQPMDYSKLDAFLDCTKGIIDKYYITMDIWSQTRFDKPFGLEWDDPAYAKAFKTWWGAVVEHLKSRGITYDDFIVNPVDECADERFTRIAGWLKDVDPKVVTIMDSYARTDNPAAVSDIWMPHYTNFFDAGSKPHIQKARDAKLPLWVYYYSESGIEKRMNPTSRYLLKFWWAYENDLTGVCYWAQQMYGDPWYRVPVPRKYDTSLSYPTETGVIPSRRWQAWRQGWQDYCLLALVKDKLQKSGDKAGLEEFNRKVHETVANGIDPDKTEVVRQWLKSKITQNP